MCWTSFSAKNVQWFSEGYHNYAIKNTGNVHLWRMRNPLKTGFVFLLILLLKRLLLLKRFKMFTSGIWIIISIVSTKIHCKSLSSNKSIVNGSYDVLKTSDVINHYYSKLSTHRQLCSSMYEGNIFNIFSIYNTFLYKTTFRKNKTNSTNLSSTSPRCTVSAYETEIF